MDTDDLSEEAYDAIIVGSENFNHDLTLQFGVLASGCASEEEYLDASEKMIGNWLENGDLRDLAEEIFYGMPIDLLAFRNTLHGILENISKVGEIPFEDREFDW